MTRSGKSLILASLMAALLLVAVSVPRFTSAQEAKPAKGAAKGGANTGSGSVARGKYLVEDVAYCTNCHTPRAQNGEFDRTKWLLGGSLFFQPAQPVPNWPLVAPRIGGNPPATDEQMITLLTTGIWIDGKPLRAPMPPFHMTREDAQAVVAYLKSLNTGGNDTGGR